MCLTSHTVPGTTGVTTRTLEATAADQEAAEAGHHTEHGQQDEATLGAS